MSHGVLNWAKHRGGKRAVRCTCGWESAPAWRGSALDQIEALRRHVRSTWPDAHHPA